MKRLFGVKKEKPPPPTLDEATGTVSHPEQKPRVDLFTVLPIGLG